MPKDWADLEPGQAAALVKIGIETERGPWVAALVAAGYEVFAINPMSTARYRERHSTSGAKSDAGDAHVLAEIVRLDRAHHRPVAGDGAALKRANRRNIDARTVEIQTALRAPALRQPAAVQSAFAVIAAGEVRLIAALNREIATLGEVVAEHFGRHPDADIYASQPGLGVILGARVLAEFGDDPHRYADAKARKNYAGTSPITRASGTKNVVLPATPKTTGSPTPSSNGPSDPFVAHLARRATTKLCEPGRSVTKPRYASSPTDSSASCTAA